jgi:EmrB/QacA subfamily drug resistance transporter
MPDTSQLNPWRWKALTFLALAQLMVVLDGTIVTIALPSAQVDLGISDGDRQWIITAYALAFGGLLLLGGRISDLWGRQRTFVVGLVGFAAASALGGAAANAAMLVGARALQGVFGALLAPAALSLLAVMFTDNKERAKAFGIYGAIAGGGAAIGLILGGFLTEYLDWRWVLYVNIPIALIAVAGAIITIREPEGSRNRAPLDLPGALLGTAGVVALVYGFARAESEGWSDGITIGMFVATAVLLVAFVQVERKVAAPLLPMRVVLDRNRGGAYLALGIALIGMFGMFLFLTYYLQVVKGYSPVRTGVAFLPMVASIIVGSTQIGARLMVRVPGRHLMGPGLLVAAVGMGLLTQMQPDSSYTTLILPAMILLGVGLGATFMPAMELGTHGVDPSDAGVASAMINTSQQVGGAIGTALLNTIAASATTAYVASNAVSAASPDELRLDAMVHGFTTAIWWATGLLVLAGLIAYTMINAGAQGGTSVSSQVSSDEGERPSDGEPAPVIAG